MRKTASTSPRFQQPHVDGRQKPLSAAAGTAGASPGTSRPGFVTFEMMDRVLESIAPVQAIPFNFVLHHGIKRLPCDPPRGHFYPVPTQHKAVPQRGTGAGERPPAADRAANAAGTLPPPRYPPPPRSARADSHPRARRGGADSSLPRFLPQREGKPRPPPAFPPLTGRPPGNSLPTAPRCRTRRHREEEPPAPRAPPRAPPPPGAGPALTEAAAPPAPVPQPPRHTGTSQQPPRDAAGPAPLPRRVCAVRGLCRGAGATSSSPSRRLNSGQRCLGAGRD